MLYIVDGTGDWDDASYEAAMETGFCRQLAFDCQPNTLYFRGPAFFGGSVKQVISVLREIDRRRDRPVYLCGYSRGGATVIMVAAALKAAKRTVEGLFLFDPVDSDVTLRDTAAIPSNVRRAYYAQRNPAHGDFFDADADAQAKTAKASGLKALKNVLSANVLPIVPSVLPIEPVKIANAARSVGTFASDTTAAASKELRSLRWKHLMARRKMFENCGLTAEPGVRLTGPHLFDGTHAALGGVLWPEGDYPERRLFEADQKCVHAVKSWMWQHFQESGLVATLIAGGSGSSRQGGTA